jgi:GWxTD domain-containing protein
VLARAGSASGASTVESLPIVRAAAFPVLVALAASGCGVPASPAAEAARAWGEGPARWLLLPGDRDALDRVATSGEFASFLQGFWSCRDDRPAPNDPTFGERFAERMTAADKLYIEPGLRGSLTPRGGALLLLGPPRFLRYSERRAPVLEGTTAAGGRPTKPVRLEVWGYLPRDLPPSLRATLHEDASSDHEIAVSFLLAERRTRLLEGDDLLELAAQAATHCRH